MPTDATKRVALTLTATQTKKVSRDAEIAGLPTATYAAQKVLESSPNSVPVLGYIPAGPEARVCHLPSTSVTPPFNLGRGRCYGLLVTGESMKAAQGISIDDGSYAFFCKDVAVPWGGIVHAEFPQSDGEHTCSLKQIFINPSDGSARFVPLNPHYDEFTKSAGEWVVCGVFIESWSPKKSDEKTEAVC